MHESPEWAGNQLFLHSQTGYNLAVRPDGQVVGVPDDDDPDSRLEISSAGDVSLVRIRGLQSGLYLCFNQDGQLYGEVDPSVEGTKFTEGFQGSYTGFRSVPYPDWYIGIKKSGLAKMGPKTGWGQKAVKFLPRRRRFD